MSSTSSAQPSGGSRLRQALTAGLLAAAMAATAVPAAAAAQPAAVPPGVDVERLGGSNRMQTSVEISGAYFPGGSSVVYLATAHAFADALVAGPAAAVEGGPVLLTPSGGLDAGVRQEIQRLDPYKVVLVGGTGALSPDVEKQVRAAVGAGVVVERIGGEDRYETSRRLVESVFGEGVNEAFLATGLDYPDALSAGPVAGAFSVPVVLVRGTSSTADAGTVGLLDSLGVSYAALVGGRGVISAGFEGGLQRAGFETHRYAGQDRYQTNQLVNDEISGISGEALVATGLDYPDALAGAAAAGFHFSPIYLSRTTCVPAASLVAMLDPAAEVELVTLLGGEGVLSENVASLESC